jgi:hypothetical protein
LKENLMKSPKRSGRKSGGNKSHYQDPAGVGTGYSPPNLWNLKPQSNQFEPTEASAIRSTKRMAGVK